jgi:mersacidin/lichenicidin family type 2 lantibiotic
MIGELYARWALDVVVDLAYHLSNDFIQRPRHYRKIPEDVASFLSDLRVASGSRPDLPDGNDRAAIYGALLDRTEVRAAGAALREAATIYSRQASDKGTNILRQDFVDRAITLRTHLTTLAGSALAAGHQRTSGIFAKATRVLTCDEVARVFGLLPAPGGAWPLNGVYSDDGAYLIEEVFRTLLQPMPIFSTTPQKFVVFQRVAHYGSLTLAGVVDDPAPWDKTDGIEVLIHSAYGWATAADDLRIDPIRAWKDPRYRLALSSVERSLLPDHPGGEIEFTDSLPVLALERQSLTSGGQICCSGPTLDAGCSTISHGGQICCSTGNICDTTTKCGQINCTFLCSSIIA